jgi:hypothetical protein
VSDNGIIVDRARNTEALLDYFDNHLPPIVDEWASILIDEVASANAVTMNAGLRARVLRTLTPRALELRPGALQDQVLKVIVDTRREGAWGIVIDEFVERKGLNAPRASERRLMISALEDLNLEPGDPAVPDAVRDHTVARVYSELVGSSSGSDPIALTSPTTRITPWNFRVRAFQSGAGRQIHPDRILAAGALAWCHEVGERMGVYVLADALVYRWWIGDVDFADADLTQQLYRYWKLRDERPSAEDRALLYRRVLAVGDAQVSDRVVINEAFPALWRSLMEEISLFLSKSESSFRSDQISRAGVFQAAGELQSNLSEHMAGMATLHVTEMYSQLRAERSDSPNLGALDILEHEEVMAQFASGTDPDVSTVVRRLASEEFSVSPNVGSIGTSADQGYKIYEWLADYRPGQVDDQDFWRLIEYGKAWILAQQAAGEGLIVSAAVDDDSGDAEVDWGEENEDEQTWSEEYDDEAAFR